MLDARWTNRRYYYFAAGAGLWYVCLPVYAFESKLKQETRTRIYSQIRSKERWSVYLSEAFCHGLRRSSGSSKVEIRHVARVRNKVSGSVGSSWRQVVRSKFDEAMSKVSGGRCQGKGGIVQLRRAKISILVWSPKELIRGGSKGFIACLPYGAFLAS